jgi:hypothetical protein
MVPFWNLLTTKNFNIMATTKTQELQKLIDGCGVSPTMFQKVFASNCIAKFHRKFIEYGNYQSNVFAIWAGSTHLIVGTFEECKKYIKDKTKEHFEQ